MEHLSSTNMLISGLFVVGYALITLEHSTRINKTAVALFLAVSIWGVLFVSGQNVPHLSGILKEHLAESSQVVFFIIGALIIVDIIHAHRGFRIVANWLNIASKRKMLWIVGGIAFALSAVIDNLTTTIVMVSLLSKILDKSEDRLIIGGAVVIAANAGGAWTPIGDVTTTMLWIGGQISALNILKVLFVPSVVCSIVSLCCLSFFIKGRFDPREIHPQKQTSEPLGHLVFGLGMAILLAVPLFKYLTGMPPYLGMLLGVAILWILTDFAHSKHDQRLHLRVTHTLSRLDLATALFFLGILLAVNGLEAAKILHQIALYLDHTLQDPKWIAISIGVVSALVDNVPLVAASMGMYPLDRFAIDSDFWNLLAYCAGTGGSMLIVGSAAGVAFMGLEQVSFFWYMRKIGLAALLGFAAGVAVYIC